MREYLKKKCLGSGLLCKDKKVCGDKCRELRQTLSTRARNRREKWLTRQNSNGDEDYKLQHPQGVFFPISSEQKQKTENLQ
jgi:hypothetical protein